MSESAKHIGRVLRRQRLRKRMTLEGAAVRAGYSKGYIGEIETGRKNPTLNVLETIVGTLDWSMASFWLAVAMECGAMARTPEERLACIAQLAAA